MLQFLKKIGLPPEKNCSFDHGDVDQTTGRVYVAHTSSGTVEVVDGQQERWIKNIPDCAGGSGVIFDTINNRIFAASRSAGHILSIEGSSTDVVLKFKTGKKPNGLAVDGERGILMTADVGDNYARFHSQNTGEVLASVRLSGRPRWSTYRKASDQYLINIMEPSGVEFISGKNFTVPAFFHPRNNSASGVDPDITLKDAMSQVPRIHNATGISESVLNATLLKYKHYTLFFFGTPYVNVLEINLYLLKTYPSIYSQYVQ